MTCARIKKEADLISEAWHHRFRVALTLAPTARAERTRQLIRELKYTYEGLNRGFPMLPIGIGHGQPPG